MIRIMITLVLSLLSLILHAQTDENKPTTTEGVTITVTVPKIVNNKGTVYFTLYDSEKTFENRDNFQKAMTAVEDNSCQITFTDVPEGRYAILCFHDTNNNQKLDFNEYFIPIEDYACSNNPQLYGPPTFEALAFEVATENLDLILNFNK